MSSDKSAFTLSRRGLLAGLANLAWIIPSALGLSQLVKFLGYAPPIDQVIRVSLGSPASLPPLPAYFEQGRVWLHRDTRGYFAADAICPHLGCVVEMEEMQGYQCGCHGSRFAADGGVLNGPAAQPMRFLLLIWQGDQIVVDRSTPVDPTFRLPVA